MTILLSKKEYEKICKTIKLADELKFKWDRYVNSLIFERNKNIQFMKKIVHRTSA